MLPVVGLHAGLELGKLSYRQVPVAVPCLIAVEAELGLKALERPVVLGPELLDLGAFQQECHQLVGAFFKRYAVNVLQEILALGGNAVAAEVGSDPLFDVDGLADVDDFLFLAVEIIDAWFFGKALEIFRRQVWGQALVRGGLLDHLFDFSFGIPFHQSGEKEGGGIGIASRTVAVFQRDVQRAAQVAKAVGGKPRADLARSAHRAELPWRPFVAFLCQLVAHEGEVEVDVVGHEDAALQHLVYLFGNHFERGRMAHQGVVDAGQREDRGRDVLLGV